MRAIRVEDEMQMMMDFYPDIFPTRKHCLDHLFCVLGNGYHWVDGELVDEDSVYANRYSLKAPIEKASPSDEWHHQRLVEAEKVWKEIWGEDYKVTAQNAKYNFEWYVNHYDVMSTNLFNYPDNIKPDWLAAIEECKHLLREDGILKEEVDK